MKKIKSLLITTSVLFSMSLNSAFAGNLDDGIDLFKNGNYDKAIELLNKVVKDEPDNPEPHLWLSKCYEGSFQLDLSIKERRLYNTLKYKQTQAKEEELRKQALENKPVAEEVKKEEDPFRIIRLDSDFVDSLVSKRNLSEETKNLKFISSKAVIELFSQVPYDSGVLDSMNREYEMRAYYGVAKHEDLIILDKVKAALLELTLDEKKFQLSQEKDQYKKKEIVKDLEKIVKEHKSIVDESAKLINKTAYIDTSPLSFQYYQYLEVSADSFIKTLEQKKTELRIAIDSTTTEINNFKSIIIPQEKELKNKSEKIDPALLETDLSKLSGYEKELVQSYYNLTEKIDRDKTRLFYYLKEQEILINAYNEANETIKNIKPDYVFKDAPLPKLQKLQRIEDVQKPQESPPPEEKNEKDTKKKK